MALSSTSLLLTSYTEHALGITKKTEWEGLLSSSTLTLTNIVFGGLQ